MIHELSVSSRDQDSQWTERLERYTSFVSSAYPIRVQKYLQSRLKWERDLRALCTSSEFRGKKPLPLKTLFFSLSLILMVHYLLNSPYYPHIRNTIGFHEYVDGTNVYCVVISIVDMGSYFFDEFPFRNTFQVALNLLHKDCLKFIKSECWVKLWIVENGAVNICVFFFINGRDCHYDETLLSSNFYSTFISCTS